MSITEEQLKERSDQSYTNGYRLGMIHGEKHGAELAAKMAQNSINPAPIVLEGNYSLIDNGENSVNPAQVALRKKYISSDNGENSLMSPGETKSILNSHIKNLLFINIDDCKAALEYYDEIPGGHQCNYKESVIKLYNRSKEIIKLIRKEYHG